MQMSKEEKKKKKGSILRRRTHPLVTPHLFYSVRSERRKMNSLLN